MPNQNENENQAGPGQFNFQKFILERTQEDKKAEMEAFLSEPQNPPGEGGFDPEAFQKRNERMMSMLTPEGAAELQKMMNPFGGDEDYDATAEDKDWLAQPDKLKWKDSSPEVSVDDMRAAHACSKRADGMECECWNTGCQFHGNCRKCLVFHLALKQFPTCQRCSVLGDYEEHYIVFSRDADK
ncbi:MAG: hypothetical protein LBN00_03480 [Oscillospiraceae bacterium]|jgi:hypothetical protein|nr:hypothetical protein [Oscillospiraceae bacterium]